MKGKKKEWGKERERERERDSGGNTKKVITRKKDHQFTENRRERKKER